MAEVWRMLAEDLRPSHREMSSWMISSGGVVGGNLLD